MSSREAPDAIHSKMISTLIRVPRTIGLPPRMAGSETMRSNMGDFLEKRSLSRVHYNVHRLPSTHDHAFSCRRVGAETFNELFNVCTLACQCPQREQTLHPQRGVPPR